MAYSEECMLIKNETLKKQKRDRMIEFIITVAVLLNYLKSKQVQKKLIYLRKSQL